MGWEGHKKFIWKRSTLASNRNQRVGGVQKQRLRAWVLASGSRGEKRKKKNGKTVEGNTNGGFRSGVEFRKTNPAKKGKRHGEFKRGERARRGRKPGVSDHRHKGGNNPFVKVFRECPLHTLRGRNKKKTTGV